LTGKSVRFPEIVPVLWPRIKLVGGQALCAILGKY